MLFVLGFIIFAVSLGIGVTLGDPYMSRWNRWDRVANIGIFIGSGLMTLSLCIFLWGLLP